MDNQYQIGSRLLGLKNPHDDDKLIIKDESSKDYIQQYENQKDTYMRTKKSLDDTMLFRLPFDKKTVRWYIVNYQLDANIIKQGFPIEYHVLDRRDDYIRLLNYVVEYQELNFKKDENLNGGNCAKGIYHVAYLTFILENNSVELTEEQRGIVQKIHDKEMPQEYLDVLKQKIKDLK